MGINGAHHVVVVGGGIAGLTAAYRLTRGAEDRRVRVTLLEAATRVGGVIASESRDGLILERGADSIITEKPWALDLCRELGLGERVIGTNADYAGSFIARGDRLHPVPEGLHLMAPSRFWSFALSGLLSIPGKLRVAADLLIPPKTDDSDESLGDFVRRRLGREALERIAQPMVGGIYTADPDRLSLAATMPRFIDLERKHGSLIRGMVAARRANDAAAGARGPRYQLFASLAGGLEELPAALARALPEGCLRLGHAVECVSRQGDGWRVRAGGMTIDADGVCLALPAHASADLLEAAAPELAGELEAIDYASTVTVNLVYRNGDIPSLPEGFGFVVPAVEGRTTMACTFASQKYAGRAPGGSTILRAFVGGAMAPRNAELDDDAILAAVSADLRDLLGITAAATEAVISRYPRSMPQYHVGHLARLERIETLLTDHPRLALAGNAYRGSGIPDCVRSGNEAAERLLVALRTERRGAAEAG